MLNLDYSTKGREMGCKNEMAIMDYKDFLCRRKFKLLRKECLTLDYIFRYTFLKLEKYKRKGMQLKDLNNPV